MEHITWNGRIKTVVFNDKYACFVVIFEPFGDQDRRTHAILLDDNEMADLCNFEIKNEVEDCITLRESAGGWLSGVIAELVMTPGNESTPVGISLPLEAVSS